VQVEAGDWQRESQSTGLWLSAATKLASIDNRGEASYTRTLFDSVVNSWDSRDWWRGVFMLRELVFAVTADGIKVRFTFSHGTVTAHRPYSEGTVSTIDGHFGSN